MIGVPRESLRRPGMMKVAICIFFCLVVLVCECSASPLPMKSQETKPEDTTKATETEDKYTTDQKSKKQLIPGIVTYNEAPSYTGYAAPFINYDPYSMGVGNPERIQDKRVEIVQIKGLDIKDGVITKSDIVQG